MVPKTSELSPRRRRSRQRRTERILQAAMAIVVEEGLQGLTIQALADRLDYAVGALYRYFPSKVVLWAALEHRALEAFGTVMDESLQGAEAYWRDHHKADAKAQALFKLLVLADTYERFSEESPELFTLFSQMLADPRQLLPQEQFDELAGVAMTLFAVIGKVFAEAVSTGALAEGDPVERVVLFWSSLHGLLGVRKVVTERLGMRETPALNRALMGTLLKGWGAKDAAMAKAFDGLDTWAKQATLPDLSFGVKAEPAAPARTVRAKSK